MRRRGPRRARMPGGTGPPDVERSETRYPSESAIAAWAAAIRAIGTRNGEHDT